MDRQNYTTHNPLLQGRFLVQPVSARSAARVSKKRTIARIECACVSAQFTLHLSYNIRLVIWYVHLIIIFEHDYNISWHVAITDYFIERKLLKMAILLRVHMFGLVVSYNSFKRLKPLIIFTSSHSIPAKHNKRKFKYCFSG